MELIINEGNYFQEPPKRTKFLSLVKRSKERIILDIIAGKPSPNINALRREKESPQTKKIEEFINKSPFYSIAYQKRGTFIKKQLKFYKGLFNHLIVQKLFNPKLLWDVSSIKNTTSTTDSGVLSLLNYKRSIGNEQFKKRHNLLVFAKEMILPQEPLPLTDWIEDLSIFFNIPTHEILRVLKQQLKILGFLLSHLVITPELQVKVFIPILTGVRFQDYEFLIREINLKNKLRLFTTYLFLQSQREIIICDNPPKEEIALLKRHRNSLFKSIILIQPEDSVEIEIEPDSICLYDNSLDSVPEPGNYVLKFIKDYLKIKFIFTTVDTRISEMMDSHGSEDLSFIFNSQELTDKVKNKEIREVSNEELVLLLSYEVERVLSSAVAYENSLIVTYFTKSSDKQLLEEASVTIREKLLDSDRLLQVENEKPTIIDYLTNKKA